MSETKVLVMPLLCAGLDWNRDECRDKAEFECFYCGRGVCIRCTEPCYTCGEHLHSDCRDDHAKEAGHPVEVPKPEREHRLNRIDAQIVELTAKVDRILERES